MTLASSLHSGLYHKPHLCCPINPILIKYTNLSCSNLNIRRSPTKSVRCSVIFSSQKPIDRYSSSFVLNCSENEPIIQSSPKESSVEEVYDIGVKGALSFLKFYRREISPLLPKSCRFVPTCSEYSMIAYKKYGFTKGTILTTWRLCRCNPLGGSGFDPPRWFDEERPTES